MNAATLFARRGPAEPFRPANLGQSDPDYTAGREAFLYGREYRPPAWNRERAHNYHCGWSHEMLDVDAATGRRFR